MKRLFFITCLVFLASCDSPELNISKNDWDSQSLKERLSSDPVVENAIIELISSRVKMKSIVENLSLDRKFSLQKELDDYKSQLSRKSSDVLKSFNHINTVVGNDIMNELVSDYNRKVTIPLIAVIKSLNNPELDEELFGSVFVEILNEFEKVKFANYRLPVNEAAYNQCVNNSYGCYAQDLVRIFEGPNCSNPQSPYCDFDITLADLTLQVNLNGCLLLILME